MEGTELRGGRYVLVRTLGEGTQGETFEAVDKREGRLVAIKRFRVGKAKAWKDVELAEREATTLASLEHELLPRYVEHFEEEGALVLVMERIEGESLAELRKKGARLGVADVQQLLADASRALSYLHGRAPPVVHRDLKPGNVLRRPDGSFAFVDFGAVRDRLKLAGGSTIVGTFGYMAPEQFQGRASPASDVYGIGATALALLTGCEPEDLPHKGLAIDVAKAVPSNTPPSLLRTLEVMLDPDPDTRARSIAEALARGGATTSASAKKTQRRTERAERKARRRAGAEPLPFPVRVAADRGDMLVADIKYVVGWCGLLLARMVVFAVVGIAVPLVLQLLSLVFGAGLRRAADACSRAAERAGTSMFRAASTLAGDEVEPEERPARVRVAADDDPLRYVRAVTPEQAQREAMRAAELRAEAEGGEDAEAWADRRATEEAERWAWEEREQGEERAEAKARAKRGS